MSRERMPHHQARDCTEAEFKTLVADHARLRRILDSRPALNAGLLETYTEWTHGVYQSDFLAKIGKMLS